MLLADLWSAYFDIKHVRFSFRNGGEMPVFPRCDLYEPHSQPGSSAFAGCVLKLLFIARFPPSPQTGIKVNNVCFYTKELAGTVSEDHKADAAVRRC